VSLSSAIEWTNASWNPVTGCTKVSAGCRNCYAERFAERFRGVPNHPFEQGFDIRIWDDRLGLPLKWKKPMFIFVNSMSDLFHEDIPDDFIFRTFQSMVQASWHRFQILTKRTARLGKLAPILPWADNIWIGTSVENDRVAKRIEQLKTVPAKTRFLSCEPLLGPLDNLDLKGIDWVIVGGESGPHARPMEAGWVRDIRDKCIKNHVAFFFKQWGGTRKHIAGRILDGRTWDQMPDST
jgi:protein gp37